MIPMKYFLLIGLLLRPVLTIGQTDIEITADFPGGNIIIEKITQDTVWLKPDLSFTSTNWL